ncbi:MAG TPA: SMC-Scp complex subunit ScpB [Terracidiphilus sp.]|nr:SMC-Scp complex subunit ScpB [Terracidiphilus sp.]
MSLKAKLEAVIYAAEEPVTLAQLAGLFADEALEWKAEQEAAAQARAQEPAAEENENSPLVQGTLPDLTVAPDAVEEAEASEALEESAGEDARATAGQETGGTEPDVDQAEAEAMRAARMRDREVRGVIKQLLDELIAEYAVDGRGVEIREIAGGYRMATKPECHDAVRSFIKGQKPPLKLSLPALETLAVIAYKQPVTAPEVNEIRGVDSSGVFGSLLARKLIVTAGRKPVIGRPILYKTTREFLLRFGLKDVSELPSMEEFEKMAASELEEPEIAEPEVAGAEPAAGEAAEAVAEFNPDLSTETDVGTNGTGANHEAETAAQSPQAASNASGSDAE